MNRTERSELRRLPERGSHDPKVIHEVLDAAFLAHVGFNASAQPFVIPMIYGRDGNALYLHGSTASRTLFVLAGGAPACFSVTLIDGLALARSRSEEHTSELQSPAMISYAVPKRYGRPAPCA